jgi:predicted DNA-binding WGR domain protein
VAADAGFPMGFQSIFAWKALPEAAFVKRQLLMLIDLNMSPSRDCDFILAQDRCFLKPRRSGRSGKSGTSQIVSFEHARASAAPAASCKRANRTLSDRKSCNSSGYPPFQHQTCGEISLEDLGSSVSADNTTVG